MVKSRREKQKAKDRKVSARAWADKQDKGFEPTSVRLPEGVEFLSLRPGSMKLDVIPYVVGKGNPNADESFLHFERRYDVHRIPQPNGKTARYICPYETFDGKACPICQWTAKNGGTADKDLLDGLRVQRRHLFCVIDVTDERERKRGIQVFDTTYGSVKYPAFGKMLKDKIDVSEKYDSFCDPEEGVTVYIKVEEDKLPGGKFNRVTAIDFLERSQQYDPDIVDQAPCLDDCLIEMPYNDLKAIFLQEGKAESNGEPTRTEKVAKPAKPQESEEEDEEDSKLEPEIVEGSTVMYKGKECEVLKVAKDGTLSLKRPDGKSVMGIEESDVELLTEEEEDELEDEDEESEEKASKDPDEDEDDEWEDEEEEDEDDEWEDEEEKPTSKKSAKKTVKKPVKK